MDPLQFTLFFAAVLIGYVLVHLRLVKFEAYLKEISVLKQLNERLSGVADAMERIKVDRLEEGLNVLHEDAVELRSATARLERGLNSVQSGGEAATALRAGPTPPERICAAIEERLSHLGYQKLRVLSDLRDVQIEDEIDVHVECERQMMPYKGKVRTRNGAVLDVDVHSVVSMFP